MAANKFMKQFQKMAGAVDRKYNPFHHGLRTSSPSVNWVFGNTHVLPFGYTGVLYGPPKSGKSLLCNAFIGQLHRDYPDAIALKYNTEMREEGQMTTRQERLYGIDPERYQSFNTNQPHEIFDKIDHDINAMCQEGAPIKLIIIDSVTGIVGRRTMNADSILKQQIGDNALTIQDGLKQILKTIREHRIALLLTAHVRAELDPNIAKYQPYKMAGSWALKHFAEYFISVEPNRSKEGKQDLSGQEFVDESVSDMMGKGERMGHKIRVAMKDSSVGPKGRVAEFTLDYHNGIVNQHEEIFHLAHRRGIVDANGRYYTVPNYPQEGTNLKFSSKMDFANAIKANPELADELVKRVRLQDIDAMENGRKGVSGAVNMAENEDAESADVMEESA
jgi:hypothetical protein